MGERVEFGRDEAVTVRIVEDFEIFEKVGPEWWSRIAATWNEIDHTRVNLVNIIPL